MTAHLETAGDGDPWSATISGLLGVVFFEGFLEGFVYESD